jgi:hypothetical protein
MGQKIGVDDSEFHMWRAVFAFALVDGVLSVEEQRLLQSYMMHVPFSHDQLETLRQDFRKPPRLLEMYRRITAQEHRERFCTLARALVWCEGSMNREEHDVLTQLDCITRDDTADDRDAAGKDRVLSHPPASSSVHQYYAKTGAAAFSRPPRSTIRIKI